MFRKFLLTLKYFLQGGFHGQWYDIESSESEKYIKIIRDHKRKQDSRPYRVIERKITERVIE